MIKKVIIAIVILALGVFSYEYYDYKVNHNFTEITKSKVYTSSFVPLDEIEALVKKNNIKTVIDLREGEVQSLLNPETKEEVVNERQVVSKLKGVTYYNLATYQVPEDSTVNKFIKILEDKNSYPVWIHCYHGVGRAVLFGAIYRIEFENWKPEDARKQTKKFVEFSSFGKTKEKGIYLINYKKRRK